MTGAWIFWQISGWYGLWTKLHYLQVGDPEVTLCGRYPNPELGSGVTKLDDDRDEDECCKTCWKIRYKNGY